MFDFQIEPDSLLLFEASFGDRATKNFRRALDSIRVSWINQFRYEQRTFSVNGVWPRLSPEYKEQKDQDFEQGRIRYNSILRRSGQLMTGYTRGVVANFNENSVQIEWPNHYARIQQYGSEGTDAGHGNIPARPFDGSRFEALAEKYFNKALNDSLNDEE